MQLQLTPLIQSLFAPLKLQSPSASFSLYQNTINELTQISYGASLFPTQHGPQLLAFPLI